MMPRSILLAATAWTLLSALGAGQTIPAADIVWPGWRGPGRDGWVPDFQPPANWPRQLQQVWRVSVGTGYASPLVAGGRVYQHARQGDDEIVWCLELETGAVKWRRSYAVPFKIGGGGERHGKGPKSSPALAAGKLFTLSITGVLSAWDADSGQLAWRRDYRSQFKKGHPYWGVATSPLIDGERVVVHFGTDGQGALVALDAASGEQVWYHGNDGASYASPILVSIEGVRQIVELNMKGLVGVDSESGRRLWEYPYPQVGTDQNMVTPAFHEGLILLGGENRGIRGVQPQRDRSDSSRWKVAERWHQEQVALDMSSAVVNGGLLFGFSHYGQGRLFCLDIKTGQVRWQGPRRTGQNVALLAIPGHMLALIDSGELQIIAARGDRFDQVASYHVSETPTWAPPVLLERAILIKDHADLTCWSLADPSAR